MKKVLVTGCAGYIGSVLIRKLLDKNYFVIGIDNLSFGGESLLGVLYNKNFRFYKIDLRDFDLVKNILKEDIFAIVHLAAVVGDPACSKKPEKAKEINWNASKNLFDFVNVKLNIQRFIFASTCSNYGKMPDVDYVNENSPLNPISLYAELKVRFEEYILNSKTRDNFYPTSLRFATVYGVSPRIRFDLTVNEFMKEVALGRELKIFGEQFWRPYCHVEDISEAIILVLEANPGLVKHNVFNVGNTQENYTKKMIAEEILKIRPNAKISYVHKEEDPRDYKVDFSKIKNILGFQTTKRVPDGLQEINYLIINNFITDPDSKKYQNT